MKRVKTQAKFVCVRISCGSILQCALDHDMLFWFFRGGATGFKKNAISLKRNYSGKDQRRSCCWWQWWSHGLCFMYSSE
ncbi:hypothetical protein PHJA_002758900 [Phtheirospermum japonicum]|uniref:Uncharacterized protein n=1 Tax=Phtheirospermum japonicum TaxID=374723 RepID=A0A830D8S9_9LAMI|nr:hypothetical protein PHJA_002758900 [Phtheirospermum japonicum]